MVLRMGNAGCISTSNINLAIDLSYWSTLYYVDTL